MMKLTITFAGNVLPTERNGLIGDLAEMGADISQSDTDSYEVTVTRAPRIESVLSQLEAEQFRGRLTITEKQK